MALSSGHRELHVVAPLSMLMHYAKERGGIFTKQYSADWQHGDEDLDLTNPSLGARKDSFSMLC